MQASSGPIHLLAPLANCLGLHSYACLVLEIDKDTHSSIILRHRTEIDSYTKKLFRDKLRAVNQFAYFLQKWVVERDIERPKDANVYSTISGIHFQPLTRSNHTANIQYIAQEIAMSGKASHSFLRREIGSHSYLRARDFKKMFRTIRGVRRTTSTTMSVIYGPKIKRISLPEYHPIYHRAKTPYESYYENVSLSRPKPSI